MAITKSHLANDPKKDAYIAIEQDDVEALRVLYATKLDINDLDQVLSLFKRATTFSKESTNIIRFFFKNADLKAAFTSKGILNYFQETDWTWEQVNVLAECGLYDMLDLEGVNDNETNKNMLDLFSLAALTGENQLKHFIQLHQKNEDSSFPDALITKFYNANTLVTSLTYLSSLKLISGLALFIKHMPKLGFKLPDEHLVNSFQLLNLIFKTPPTEVSKQKLYLKYDFTWYEGFVSCMGYYVLKLNDLALRANADTAKVSIYVHIKSYLESIIDINLDSSFYPRLRLRSVVVDKFFSEFLMTHYDSEFCKIIVPFIKTLIFCNDKKVNDKSEYLLKTFKSIPAIIKIPNYVDFDDLIKSLHTNPTEFSAERKNVIISLLELKIKELHIDLNDFDACMKNFKYLKPALKTNILCYYIFKYDFESVVSQIKYVTCLEPLYELGYNPIDILQYVSYEKIKAKITHKILNSF